MVQSDSIRHPERYTEVTGLIDCIVLSRRFPLRDTSSQAYAGVAYREGYHHIVTYDRSGFTQEATSGFHAEQSMACLTAGQLLDRLGKA